MNKENASKNFFKLLEIVEQLRGPDGCDWDKKQTAESLLPYFLEETYEVIESVDNKNWENFQEELGDVLLHVVLQSQIAHEENKFSIVDSIKTLNKKLIKRHPHVFSDQVLNDVSDIKKSWEEIVSEMGIQNDDEIIIYDKIVTRSLFGNINASRNSA